MFIEFQLNGWMYLLRAVLDGETVLKPIFPYSLVLAMLIAFREKYSLSLTLATSSNWNVDLTTKTHAAVWNH